MVLLIDRSNHAVVARENARRVNAAVTRSGSLQGPNSTVECLGRTCRHSTRNHPQWPPVVNEKSSEVPECDVSPCCCAWSSRSRSFPRSVRVSTAFLPIGPNALPQYEKRVQFLTAGIKRDAFIISRVTLAVGDLTDDFQKLSAIQKAVTASRKRTCARDETAGEHAHVDRAQEDDRQLEDGRRQAQQGSGIQRELFQQLSDARGERQNLVDLLNRVQIMNADLEAAMVDALGSTFDYMASGGK